VACPQFRCKTDKMSEVNPKNKIQRTTKVIAYFLIPFIFVCTLYGIGMWAEYSSDASDSDGSGKGLMLFIILAPIVFGIAFYINFKLLQKIRENIERLIPCLTKIVVWPCAIVSCIMGLTAFPKLISIWITAMMFGTILAISLVWAIPVWFIFRNKEQWKSVA
jgi:hypothetical protein